MHEYFMIRALENDMVVYKGKNGYVWIAHDELGAEPPVFYTSLTAARRVVTQMRNSRGYKYKNIEIINCTLNIGDPV